MMRNVGPTEIDYYFKNKYPLLMIDKCEEIEPGVCAKGFKNFSNNEWFFPAHFRDNPNVPGSIMLECMLDLFVMAIVTLPECEGKETADFKINNLLFKRKIVPGERLDLECKIQSFRRGIATGTATGYVNGLLACSSEITVCVPELMITMSRK